MSEWPGRCRNCGCPWNSCLIHGEFCCDACSHPDEPRSLEQGDDRPPWRCICGSGDNGEWHSIMCVASNTPDEVWHSQG